METRRKTTEERIHKRPTKVVRKSVHDEDDPLLIKRRRTKPILTCYSETLNALNTQDIESEATRQSKAKAVSIAANLRGEVDK